MEQAKIQVSLAHTHEARLDEFGWPVEQTAHLSERTGVLGQLYSARSQTTDTSKAAAIGEQYQLDSTKTFITRIRIAAPMARGKTTTPGVTPGAFKIGAPLGRSVPRHIRYLLRIRPFVEILDGALKPYFGGQSPLAELDARKAALENSETLQETLRGSLPASTLKILELSGEVHSLIDDLNRVARLAFHDDPGTASQFNKNLIRRTGRSRKPLIIVPPPEAEAASPEAV